MHVTTQGQHSANPTPTPPAPFSELAAVSSLGPAFVLTIARVANKSEGYVWRMHYASSLMSSPFAQLQHIRDESWLSSSTAA